jgi:hypothetical protein
MEKPIVFLSHSSANKAPLAIIRQMLDERAAGSLNFFLSSDGESIKFGRNWVVRISDALSEAKLMFVFISQQSADSKWIHFEAGCAYAQNVQVVPVCLPGIDLNRITPPLNLLQGFNLHSHEALGNLARICNDTLGLKINETFSPRDFENINNTLVGVAGGFFGNEAETIESIYIEANGFRIPGFEFDPIPLLKELCEKAGTVCFNSFKVANTHALHSSFEQPGCLVEFEHSESQAVAKDRAHRIFGPVQSFTDKLTGGIHITLSADLFHVNAPLLNDWFTKTSVTLNSVSVTFVFQKGIEVAGERHHLTTKLHQSGIHMTGLNSGFEFQGFKFRILDYRKQVAIQYALSGPLMDERLPAIIKKLFSSGILRERQPDIESLFQ